MAAAGVFQECLCPVASLSLSLPLHVCVFVPRVCVSESSAVFSCPPPSHLFRPSAFLRAASDPAAVLQLGALDASYLADDGLLTSISTVPESGLSRKISHTSLVYR